MVQLELKLWLRHTTYDLTIDGFIPGYVRTTPTHIFARSSPENIISATANEECRRQCRHR